MSVLLKKRDRQSVPTTLALLLSKVFQILSPAT
jgi:hypothetical protein